jgi:hypothetical protein
VKHKGKKQCRLSLSTPLTGCDDRGKMLREYKFSFFLLKRFAFEFFLNLLSFFLFLLSKAKKKEREREREGTALLTTSQLASLFLSPFFSLF